MYAKMKIKFLYSRTYFIEISWFFFSNDALFFCCVEEKNIMVFFLRNGYEICKAQHSNTPKLCQLEQLTKTKHIKQTTRNVLGEILLVFFLYHFYCAHSMRCVACEMVRMMNESHPFTHPSSA